MIKQEAKAGEMIVVRSWRAKDLAKIALAFAFVVLLVQQIAGIAAVAAAGADKLFLRDAPIKVSHLKALTDIAESLCARNGGAVHLEPPTVLRPNYNVQCRDGARFRDLQIDLN